MIKKCYVCKELIEDEKYEFHELYGYSHINCVQAKGCVVAKELNVQKFEKGTTAAATTREERRKLKEENTIDEFKD